ncbi:MAG: MFS transporter [Actinomycetota bacterium]
MTTPQPGGRIPAAARPILVLTFVNALGGTLLIPVLPFVVRDLGYGDLVYALLIAAYPAAQFFAAPILGGYADHRGRRPVLLVSQAGTLLSWFLFAGAYFVDADGVALSLIVASRVVDGLTGGNQSVASAYLADVVEGPDRTRVFSAQGAIAGVALLVGPTLGSYSAALSIGFLGTALVAIAISTATLVLLTTLRESLSDDLRAPSFDANPLHQLNLIGNARSLTGADTLIRLFAVGGLFNVTIGAYGTIVVLWYVDGLGISESTTGLMFLATGTFLIFNETVSLRAFQSRLGDTGTLMAGLLLVPFALVVLAVPSSVPPFLAALFFLNLGFALIIPTLQSVVTRAADEHEEGVAQGINTSVGAMASALAPIGAGVVYAAGGGRASFITAAVVAAMAAALGLASRSAIRRSVGETDPQTDDHGHGPVHSLVSVISGSGRHHGLRLQGGHLLHHNVKRSDAT